MKIFIVTRKRLLCATCLLLGLIFGYFITLSPTLFLALSIAVLSGACLGFYRLMCGWGVRKWDSL